MTLTCVMHKNLDGISKTMHFASTRTTNTLILCKERMAGCGYSHMGHVNILCGKNFRIHGVKSDGTYTSVRQTKTLKS